jgi:hypothetical protein
MTAGFQPNLAILPAPQRQLWSELGAVPGEFARLFDPAILAARLPFLNGATITQQAPNTLSAIVERGGPVQISFFGLPDIARLRPPHIASGNGLRIASPRSLRTAALICRPRLDRLPDVTRG